MWRLKLGLIAIVALGTACSGDDGLTDEEDFARRVEAHKEATFGVTFRWEYESPNLGPLRDTRTWYQDGDRERLDYQQESVKAVSLWTGEHTYECSAYPNRISGESGCFLDVGSNLLSISPMNEILPAINEPERYDITRIENREFAGAESHCYIADAIRLRERDLTMCFTADGPITEFGPRWGRAKLGGDGGLSRSPRWHLRATDGGDRGASKLQYARLLSELRLEYEPVSERQDHGNDVS